MLKKYRFLNTLLLLAMLIWTSCEKGEDMIHVDSIVYIPNSGLTTQTALLGESVFKLGVYKAGVNQKDAQITVNLGVDQEAFTAFLRTNPGYELLPSSNYNVPSGELKIGNEREDLNIRLTNISENTFSGKKYVLPVSIKNVNEGAKINEVKKVAFLYFSRFRNVYESKYRAYGQVVSEVGTVTKIDEVQMPVSVSANALEVSDAATGLKLRLTVLNNKVNITGAPGFESYNVQNNAAKGESTYSGQFDPVYQAYKGAFRLFYSYTLGGKQRQVAVDLSFTL
jgi:hypothetical protein